LGLGHYFSFFNLYTVGRTPWTGDQPVTRPLSTHRINAHRYIHALSGIRTHDPSVRASEDGSCHIAIYSILYSYTFHMAKLTRNTILHRKINCFFPVHVIKHICTLSYFRRIYANAILWLSPCVLVTGYGHTLFICNERID
jgi:hypothetical protein